jgi:hypothetical protein
MQVACYGIGLNELKSQFYCMHLCINCDVNVTSILSVCRYFITRLCINNKDFNGVLDVYKGGGGGQPLKHPSKYGGEFCYEPIYYPS